MSWLKIKRTALLLILSSLLSTLFLNCSSGKSFEALSSEAARYDKAVMSAPVPEICTRQKLEMIIGAQRGGWSNSTNTKADEKTAVDWVHVV